jgi:hypothetical protein
MKKRILTGRMSALDEALDLAFDSRIQTLYSDPLFLLTLPEVLIL